MLYIDSIGDRTERFRLGVGSVDELDGRDKHAGNAAVFEVN